MVKMSPQLSRRSLCLALTFIAAVGIARSDPLAPFIEVRPGTLPIIFTVPHGGTLKPAGIRTRTFGKVSQDSNTAELAELISREMQQLFQGTPHIVFCRLHRTKVDCNRELSEAAQGDPLAIESWQRFHAAADGFRKQVTQQHGAGLLLDLHGHRHEEGRVELGYLVTGTQLSVSNESLNANARLIEQSSIRDLVARSSKSFAELLRGPQSLGAMLEDKGIKAIPSPAMPAPVGDALYYSGAYDITAHGSSSGGAVSAIQIECPWQGVRDTPENLRRFARAFAEVLGSYHKIHFGFELGKSS